MSGTYEHFIYTKHDGSALARAYQNAGYLVEVKKYVSEEYDVVTVYCDLDKHLAHEDADVIDIANEHGAEYDGGGTYVGPIESLVNPEERP